MFTVFKKGGRPVVDNYKGISVISSLSKLYDMVLCYRLNLGFRPFREQAGAQSKCGWTEHIAAVHTSLLTDAARWEKRELYVTIIDSSKAYDLVPRDNLFVILKHTGAVW